MRTDGSGLHLVADSGASDIAPAWSPDSQTLSFISEEGPRRAAIWVVHDTGAAGEDPHSKRSRLAGAAVWSPDGTEAAYWGRYDGSGVYLYRFHGGHSTKLAGLPADPARPSAVDISWSPDGRIIAIAMGGRLYTMYADGSGLTEQPITGRIRSVAYRP
jgi:Tol biopolymer transport system component